MLKQDMAVHKRLIDESKCSCSSHLSTNKVSFEPEPPVSPVPSIYLDAEDSNNQERVNMSITSIESLMDEDSHHLNCA